MWLRHYVYSTALTLVMSFAASHAAADESRFQCQQGELLRSVMVVYEIPGKAVPCQVIYSKPSENEADEVLWSANSESGYCEFKAREFRAQLESWGWVCSADSDAPAEPEQLGDGADPPAPPANVDLPD